MRQFIKSLLNPNGEISFGRFMALVTCVFCLGWDTSNLVFAWHINHHLPAGIGLQSLLPDSGILIAQGAFMTVFYGVTKAVELKNPPTQ
jgi:hypothetical protein